MKSKIIILLTIIFISLNTYSQSWFEYIKERRKWSDFNYAKKYPDSVSILDLRNYIYENNKLPRELTMFKNLNELFIGNLVKACISWVDAPHGVTFKESKLRKYQNGL